MNASPSEIVAATIMTPSVEELAKQLSQARGAGRLVEALSDALFGTSTSTMLAFVLAALVDKQLLSPIDAARALVRCREQSVTARSGAATAPSGEGGRTTAATPA